jgi:hypothetical protein
VLVAAVLAVHAAVAAERLGWLFAAGGAAGAGVLAVALAFRLAGLVTAAVVLLGAEYAGFFLVRGGDLDRRAPLYAAGFLLLAELAFGALERRAPGPPELILRRAGALVLLALAAVVLGAVVLAAASLPAGGGLALHAAGVAAAVALVLLLGRLALRPPG